MTDARWIRRLQPRSVRVRLYSVFALLFFLAPVSLLTKVVDLGLHPPQEEFSRGRGNPRPLELENFLPLAPYLDAHVLNFPSDVV